jgi:hypothetical protein
LVDGFAELETVCLPDGMAAADPPEAGSTLGAMFAQAVARSARRVMPS